MTKSTKMSKGQIQHAINNRKPKSAAGMTQDTINQIAAGAERTRVAILESVAAEIAALQDQLAGAIDMEAPEIPATLLTAIADIKANVTKKAWLGYFGIYHQYGIVPRAVKPVPDEPTTGLAVVDDTEEKQATADLAAEREKMVKEREDKS